MQENMRRRVLIAKKPAIGTLRRLLTPRASMNAPIRDAFDCSSRKPMRRHFVSWFPRALLSLSQEKSSGVEIEVTQAHCVRHVGIKIKRTYEAKFRSENLLENGNKNR